MIWSSLALYAFYVAASAAYNIRLFALREYGPVIHEFDPYFNYRATEVRQRRKTALSYYTKRD
jgi:dolichyl-diphosphooligosaccharide--protein glycosyltransferase